MTHYDVFNGDADGLCALHQLRLAEPLDSRLITGPKRDIHLLQRLIDEASSGDRVTVLDISLDTNREPLLALLKAGVAVDYFDHHYAGSLPDHPQLTATIDTAAEVCTALLVDHHLGGRYRAWAVTAAFGDNLFATAREAAKQLALDEGELEALQELGTLLNYNGYGVTVQDLHFHPEELYRLMSPYSDPFAFIADEPAFRQLRDGYRSDMASAANLGTLLDTPHALALQLPDEPWARRVSGVLGNQMAQQHPARAHALLTELADGGFRVSVRAPVDRREGADTLCLQFPGGGGRKAAAGINRLDEGQLDHFLREFSIQFTP